MTDLKKDYNVIYSEIKVYEKKYKRKGKNGKQVTVNTVQNSILLPKNIPFKSSESVVIMKEETFQDLTKDHNYNTADLLKKIKDKDNEIRELKQKLEMDQPPSDNELVTTLVEDLRIANHRSQEMQQEIKDMAVEITTYIDKLEENKRVFNLINSYCEKLLKEAINTSVDETIAEINKELKETNFIQRIKGLQIVHTPTINDDKIISTSVDDLNKFIKGYDHFKQVK